MFEKALILGLYSVTPVHAGSGAELSVIDLPIQRERHTGFPVVWGQSLKGVLRSCFRRLELNEDNGSKWINSAWIYITGKSKDEYKDKEEKKKAEKSIKTYIEKVKQGRRDPPLTEIIFGPSTEAASEHSGAISVGDAKILLFPVRSLKGVFAYVTCPLVLERFKRDLEVAGFSPSFNVPTVNEDSAMVSENPSLLVEGKVVLEDIVLKADQQDVSKVIGDISNVSPIQIDESRIAIVHDDVFRNIVAMTTEVVARIKIDAKTGTVQTGALWYEEYLPSDTLLYSVIAIGKPKKSVNGLSTVKAIANELNKFDCKFLQVGGNETVGKGFVKLKVWGDNNERSQEP